MTRFSRSSIRENFIAIGHRGYARLLRELRALQNRLYDCTKFEKLIRYRCANLFFLVLPEQLFRDPEIPVGWGALVESNGKLILARKPVWHETTARKPHSPFAPNRRGGHREL